MSSPRKTGRGDIILSAKRSKSLSMDGQNIQGKCPDMKIVGMMNLRKMKVPLRKLHYQQTHRSSQYAKRKNLRKTNHRKRVLSSRRCGRRKREYHQMHQHKERCKGIWSGSTDLNLRTFTER
jgi:hypothetical protein